MVKGQQGPKLKFTPFEDLKFTYYLTLDAYIWTLHLDFYQVDTSSQSYTYNV